MLQIYNNSRTFWHFYNAYGQPLPDDYITWGISLIIAGVITAMCIDVYHSLKEPPEE